MKKRLNLNQAILKKKSPKINPPTYGQLIIDKGGKNI